MNKSLRPSAKGGVTALVDVFSQRHSFPCGYYGPPKRECRCPQGAIERYRQRVSGPLSDRIDIHVEAPTVEYDKLTSTGPGGKFGGHPGTMRKRCGKPCISGLRINAHDILEYLAGGMSEDEILTDFSELKREDMRVCLAFAAVRECKLFVSAAARLRPR